MKKLAGPFLIMLLLGACGAESIIAPDSEVQRYDTPGIGSPSVTLITVERVVNGEGGHSALVINAPSQRVIFDPAGTFESDLTPERNDVHFGITDYMERAFVDYHVREAWYSRLQTVEVPAAVAEDLLVRTKAYGAVPQALCGRAVTDLLRGTPGFETMQSRWWPHRIARDFGSIPGVTERLVYQGDPDYEGYIILENPKP